MEKIVREEEEENIVMQTADIRIGAKWNHFQSARLNHEEAGLADHTATAEDTSEGRTSSEEIDWGGGDPVAPTAGKHILEESLAQKLHEKENGDPGGGREESQGGIGLPVLEIEEEPELDSNPGQENEAGAS